MRASSFLAALVLVGCAGETTQPPGRDASGPRLDAAAQDLGAPRDADPSDGPVDAAVDGGSADAGAPDADAPDAATEDAGAPSDPLAGAGAAEEVASGLLFTEGPLWIDGRLLFSDIPADTIYALEEGEAPRVFRRPSRNANGLARDPAGRLLAAEHGARRLSRTLADGTVEAVARSFEGLRFNSPNDITVRSDGTIYFTDPEWGIVGNLDAREMDVNGLYRVDPAGAVSREWSTPWQGHGRTPRPNGVVLSPDERRLYMSDDLSAEVLVFDVAESGALSGVIGRIATSPTPDGLAMDAAGNLYVATSRGVEVFAPSGDLWGRLALGACSNAAFGGADARTLYVTCGDAVQAVRLRQEGLR